MSEAPKKPELVTVTIDGRTAQVPKGTLLVEAAKQVGIEIPVFCYHQKLDPAGLCRMCLVQVEKMPKPATACTTQASDGMVVHTDNAVVEDLRKGVLEFLLLNHPLDCPVCDKGGECDLQDLTFEYGLGDSRMLDEKERSRKAVDLGPFIVLDEERCILCRRCVRFDNEVAGEQTLVVAERGHLNVVTTNDALPYDSYYSGNTIELCPVGALTSEVYRFKARPWDISSVDGICTGCSLGCNVRQDFRHGRLLRLISKENAEVDNGWLCDRGRFNYGYVTIDPGKLVTEEDEVERDPLGRAAARLTAPLMRKNGELVPASWRSALTEAARRLKEISSEKGGSAIGLIGAGRLTNEEAYLFQKFGRVSLGTNNIDHRVAGQTVASLEGFSGRLTDLDEAQVTLLVDVVPAEQAPVLDLRIRRGLERRRMKMLTVGPVMPTYRTRHARMQVRPGQTALVLEALTQALSGQAKAAAAKLLAAGINYDELALTKAAEVVTYGEKMTVVWDGGDAVTGKALVNLLRAVSKNRKVKLIIAGEQNNSRGAEQMGVRPDFLPGLKPVSDAAARQTAERAWRTKLPAEPGLTTREMLEAAAAGSLKALVLNSANLLGTYPDGALAKKALEQVDLLIVTDLFLTETADLADFVFPAAPFTMKEGSYTNLDGLVQHIKHASDEDGRSLPDLKIIDALSAIMGIDLMPSTKDLAREMKHLAGDLSDGKVLPGLPLAALERAAAAQTAFAGDATDRTAAQPAAGELSLVPIVKLFAGGGTARFDPGLADVYPETEALLNPADAKRLGFAEGDRIEVAGPLGTALLAVELDKAVQPGTLQAIGGLVVSGANRIGLPGQSVALTLKQRAMVEVG